MVVEGQLEGKKAQSWLFNSVKQCYAFLNYFYYFDILYTRASNKNMSLPFFKEDTILH